MQRRGVFAFFCLRGYTKLGYADPEATCEAGGPSGMTIKTADEFFAVLEKSRLLEAKQLVEARRVAAEVENPEDATAVAKALARQGLISHWQAGLLLAGRTLFFMGKYKLIRKLGRAGGGSVFLGQHVTMNRRVALKFISRQMGKDRDSLDRFLAEARAIATLDHPNIVRAYSVDNEGDRYYLVMEYIDGLDLQQLVEREGRLDCGLAADYIRQAAEGLAHAHAHNMVHGAVRPCHLLVSRQGVVKIRDVGLSRLVEGDGGGPRPEQGAAGPAGYLAPEQAGGGGEVDCRSDIYGLGCTLYLLLTGHAPSAEAASAERGGQRQSQLSGDIRRQRPDAPAPLADLCAKMMAARPANRPQSAAEVSHALEPWAAASGPKEVVVVNAPAEEEEAAGAEVDFAGDPWWNSLAVAPTRAGTSPRKSGPVRAVKAAPAAKPAAKTAAKAAAKDLPAKMPGKSPGWLGTPRRKLIVLGGLALIVALAVGGAVMMLLSGPSQPGAVTQKSPHTDKEKTAATTATPAETAPPKTAPPKTTKEVFPDIQVGAVTTDHGKGAGGPGPAGQPAAATAEAKQPPKTATATRLQPRPQLPRRSPRRRRRRRPSPPRLLRRIRKIPWAT